MGTKTFTLNFNVTGDERKRLVKAIADFMQADSKYLGAPTFAYQVDCFTIDKNGCVTFDDCADSKEIEGLIENLYELGFETINIESRTERNESENIEIAEHENSGFENAIRVLNVSVPTAALPEEALENLRGIITAKGNLIKKALGVDSLEIEVEEHKISFPWFKGNLTAEDINAYQQFIGALCKFARNAKRVTAKEKRSATKNTHSAVSCCVSDL